MEFNINLVVTLLCSSFKCSYTDVVFIQCLLGAVLLLFSTSVCAQVTPGDEDASCVAKLGDPMESVKVLLDSRHYNQLLGVEGAVWDQIDFDDNNNGGNVNPTHVSHSPCI